MIKNILLTCILLLVTFSCVKPGELAERNNPYDPNAQNYNELLTIPNRELVHVPEGTFYQEDIFVFFFSNGFGIFFLNFTRNKKAT